MVLKDITSPEQLKKMNADEIQHLMNSLRKRITEVVSENGGHLASNLGVVELTVALHRVFDMPEDKIIFDVGHQCYAHKLLTGRQDRFHTLRTYGGISGFPKSAESPYDVYETGHASTALSAALGMARARDIYGGKEHIIAVVGDGAFTGGMCFEALNDVGSRKTRLIIILNDNQMSILPNVGAMSNYLTYMRTSVGWLGIKKRVTNTLLKLPVLGKPVHRFVKHFKNRVRDVFVKDTFFQAMGMRYLGPIDGQDEVNLEKVLRRASNIDEPVLLHVVTTKGAGYMHAELEPARMHGTPPFDIQSGLPKKTSKARSFGTAAGLLLTERAKENPNIAVVTAAMTESTGFLPFMQAFPERLFDVGIAEEHAVTLAAGMAKRGIRPVVAVYDTFIQRAYDQVMMDVCLQNLPVLFLLDRAAIGGEDGPTHHGIFGTSWMRPVPNIQVLSPCCVEELTDMIDYALSCNGPVAIRYSRAENTAPDLPYEGFTCGTWPTLFQGRDLAIITMGGMVNEAIQVRELLAAGGMDVAVINASTIKPLDKSLLAVLTARGLPYVVLEEQMLSGGLGSSISELCIQQGWTVPLHIFALPDTFIPHGDRASLLKLTRLDAASVAQDIRMLTEGFHEAQG